MYFFQGRQREEGKGSAGRRVGGATLVGLPVPLGAQQPIRVGASLSLTGTHAALGQSQHRGYQLCVKHNNEKAGVLGRNLALLVEDDQSQGPAAARICEKLITQEKVDVEAVADVNERHRMPMVAANAAATSIFKKGRKFVFMMHSPAEVYLEGLIDMAAERGLKTVAVINEDTLFPKASAQGTADLVANPDVLAVATYFEGAVAISRRLKAANVSPKMFGVTVGGDLPKFYEILGRTAEFIYGASQWEPDLVTFRAGGLIPIARQYPGAIEFIESHRKEFPGGDLSYHSAAGYGACQIFVEAIRRAGSLDGERIRDAILKVDTHTVYGAFKVDQDGFQIAHKMVTFQWQDGKKIIVWPDELAPGTPRFPTPPWSQRP